jgi:hypothetical protein
MDMKIRTLDSLPKTCTVVQNSLFVIKYTGSKNMCISPQQREHYSTIRYVQKAIRLAK